MPCKGKYKRIRSKDVGRRGHHFIRIGVTKHRGKSGGTTEQIGGLRSYKRQPMDYEMRGGGTMRDGRGWHGDPRGHSDAALKGSRSKVKKTDRKFSRQELTAMTYAKSSEDREFEEREAKRRKEEGGRLVWVGGKPRKK